MLGNMDSAIPSFEPDEVALLVGVVERALEHLYQANEQTGGNDAELLEYGRRYSVILQKLNTIVSRTKAEH